MTDRETKLVHRNILTSLLITTSEQSTRQGFIVELALFFVRYTFLREQSSNNQNSGVQKTPQLNAPQGNIYMGARYLDPKYSRWLSTDPALGDFVSSDYKGTSGGIYNSVNLNLYHYANNNPIRYVDPDGQDAGCVQNENAVGIFGHAGLFVKTENGYSFFEVRGITNDEIKNGKVSEHEDSVILSHAKMAIPPAGSRKGSNSSSVSSGKEGTPSEAGVVQLNFKDKDSLIDYLKKNGSNDGFDSYIEFDQTTPKQDKIIYDAAVQSGKSFGHYSVIGNSCGIWAYNTLITAESGIKPFDEFAYMYRKYGRDMYRYNLELLVR